MLSIGKLGRGQERYYLEKVAEGAEDYYAGEGEAKGYWLGDAARELGLQGGVEPEQLTAMLTGRNPADGELLLSMNGVRGKAPVPGFDLTFSAPKSVSLLWALGEAETRSAVLDAHERSISNALAYMQREACWARRGAGGREFVPGDGFLAAAYRHRASRAGDPQLHTHVLIANATKGPDGRWSRLHHPSIYEHAKTASYLYEANLRHELSLSLGVGWKPVRKGLAEIEGFSNYALEKFSTRRTQILMAVGEGASARERQVAALTTRSAKREAELSTEDMRERWSTEAEDVGLDRERIEAVQNRSLDGRDRTVLTLEQLDRAVTAHASHFQRKEAVQAVATSLRHGAPAAEIEIVADRFLASDAVISLGATAKGERFTTVRVWEIEQRALEASQRLRDTNDRACLNELAVERVLAARPSLKADQRTMVRGLLGEGSGLSVVIGEAGTGKSYALRVAAEGWADAGISLRALAPTWRAVDVLRSEGLKADSVASELVWMEAREERGSPAVPRNSVLIVDEAGMLDSASLARLIDHAERAQAKLVLIGDPQQLGEIEAGGLFGMLADRSPPYVLDEVIRHVYEIEREAAKLIREGKGGDALDLYRAENRIVVASDAGARREAMVADWWESFSAGDDALMVTKRNADVAELNARARATMAEHGRLGEAEIEVGENCFAQGDQVITRVNDHANQIFNRERWRIAEVDAEQRRVLLDGIDQERSVEVDAAYLDRINPHNGAPAIEHGYAATTYCAQGATVDKAFVAVDPSMDKQEFYVAASRSREETMLYATPEIDADREAFAPRSPYLRDGLDHIAEAMQRDRAQIAAHEAVRREELSQLDSGDLGARREELQPAVEAESHLAERHQDLEGRIERLGARLEAQIAKREQIEGMRRGERRELLPQAQTREEALRAALEHTREAQRGLEAPRDEATREAAAIDAVLAQRRELAVTAARVSPPNYIAKELGERPTEPEQRWDWDRGVEQIERYRQEHGIKDTEHAFGKEPKDQTQRLEREIAQERLQDTQRELGLGRGAEHSHDLGQELGGGMEIGM
jgi:conjugative relaxase-like TrwC/TraI family protein